MVIFLFLLGFGVVIRFVAIILFVVIVGDVAFCDFRASAGAAAAPVATVAREVLYFCLLSFFLLLLLLLLLLSFFLLDASPGGLPGGASTMVGSFTRIGASRCC